MTDSSLTNKKSGIRTFKAGEEVFKQNDPADSLYIIQRGQIRLYIPKGRGFVDLAILRSGEVIGEMAYFDKEASRRSCSASAIVDTDVIEISFNAFEKTMEGLNPWFQTIINTLAQRLRKTNDKVKQLESNSVGFGRGGKVADYKFLINADVVKMLSLLYLTVKTHGEIVDGRLQIHINKVKFYMYDVFGVQEAKFEEFLLVLITDRFIEMSMDESNMPKIVNVDNVELFRTIMIFLNTQRILDDNKQVNISSKCERFLKAILNQFMMIGVTKPKYMADVSAILADFKEKKILISDEDLADAIEHGICEEVLVGEGNKLTSVVDYDKLRKLYPSIRMMNAIKALNESKLGAHKYD